MATAAELKARLLKYAKPIQESSGTVQAEKSSAGPVANGEAKQLPVSPTGGTDQPIGGGSERELRSEESRTVPDSVGSVALAVTTDLQPTTLVVVERPAAVDVGTSGEQSSTDTEPSTNLDTSNPIHSNFLQLLNDVEAAMLARDPLMKTHLGAIHKNMLQYEEIANLLRPEEIAKIMAAQQAHTGIVLRAETVGKSKAAASKKAAQLGLNDV